MKKFLKRSLEKGGVTRETIVRTGGPRRSENLRERERRDRVNLVDRNGFQRGGAEENEGEKGIRNPLTGSIITR